MRGAHVRHGCFKLSERIIPADVGSTSLASDMVPSAKDHPRGCGEHTWTTLTRSSRTGSSPRMRGAPLPATTATHKPGIIPADAGSTSSQASSDASNADHPRGCGEHDLGRREPKKVSGSSPRMRGAHLRNQVKNLSDRIIPADAGSTPSSPSARIRGADHPRGCGEHCRHRRIRASTEGSSPRMRGALPGVVRRNVDYGIIPADAGSTPACGLKFHRSEDHPRGCGEHADFDSLNLSPAGSSPRMRGAQQTFRKAVAEVGIIPADAGSTEDSELGITAAEDHPRGCGEHLGPGLAVIPPCGSSPRMRGAQGVTVYRNPDDRIIPADAGSTPTDRCPFGMAEDHPRGCGEHLILGP